MNVDFNGGKLTATSGANAIGGNTTINATSGWIKASKYGGSVTIAEGKYMKDETGRCYKGTLTDAEKAAAAGKTLQPATQTEYISYIFGGGNGSQNSPYLIGSTESWNYFCDALLDNNTWNHFSGKTVKLGANITVTQMAGGSNHAFTGTFDGDGHTLTLNYGTADAPVDAQFVAPFVETSSDGNHQPVFRNLTIDGTIYDSYSGSEAHNVGGLIGHLYGDVTIEHCTSRVHITSVGGAGGFVGLCEHTAMFTDCKSSAAITSPGGNNSGFVSWSRASGHAISFEGCVFNGKLLQQNGNGASNGCFIGWTGSNKTVTFTNCLCAPAATTSGETMATGNSATFARGWNATTTATNSYYTQDFNDGEHNTGQGKQLRTIAAGENVSVAHAGVATVYDVSGITAYKASAQGTTFIPGLLYNNNVHYAGSGEAVSLTLTNTPPTGYTLDSYTASPDGATLSEDGDNYTLTMPDANVTITATFIELTPVSVSYIDGKGVEQTVDAIPLMGTETNLGSYGKTTWYVVNSDITYTGTVTLNGSTTIILKNGCTMSIGEDADGKRINGTGIDGHENYPLTIYGQSLDDATAGHLKIFTTGDNVSYGISYSPYTQHSGNVTVKATGDWKTIYTYGDITVNGGTLSATSLADDAVVAASGGNIIINGGKVNATSSTNSALWNISGDVTINGGQVEATGPIGIYASQGGTITLGWTNATDFIKASSYEGTVQVADGLAFLTDDATPQQVSGTVGNLSLIDGKKLSPNLAAAFTANSDGSYTIVNANGWGLFCDRLAADDGKAFFSGKTVRLANDITVTRMAGNVNHDFTGTFDGNHKTLTFNHTAADNYCAPFRYVQGSSNTDHAIIQNLNVVSNITAADYRHPAGLIALQSGYVDVTDCNAVVNINCTKGTNNPNDLYPAGLVSQSNNTGSLTVSGCTVSGTISTDGKYAAGMVGIVQSSASITNSVSSVTINSSTSGDGTHSGFVASLPSGRHLTIEGCVFNGKIVTTNGTTNCGGFLGHNNTSDGTGATITNCLYAPAADPNTVSTGCATFGRNVSSDLISNCYYTTALGDAQGTQAYSISGGDYVTVANAGTATTYDVSGITSYGTGILYGGVLYAGNGDEVSLTLAHQDREGYDFIGYTATAGNLNGSTLTMPNGNVTINAEYTYPPSELTATDITFTTATLNWNGLQESYNVRYHPVNVILNEGFESGTMPDGWTRTGSSQNVDYQWKITSATGRDDLKGAATGNFNAGCFIAGYNDSDILITPVMDLGNVASATLSFNFWNTAWGEDINILKVYYRVNGGEWHLLYTYGNATGSWILVTINLEGMAANYQIGFECEGHYSYGMGIDDVKVIDNGAWTTVTNVSSPHDLTGLMPGTPYFWQVQGSNCEGEGSTTEWSESGTFTTLNPCETPYELTAAATATTATLNWNGLQESYNVRYQPAVVFLNEGFESGTMPDGWTRTGAYWQVTSGTGYDDYTGAATGNYNAGCYIDNYNDSDILITPVIDLGNVVSATLSFNFWNTVDYGDINTLNVYYRVDEGEWQSLYTYGDATEGWIPVTINLQGMAAHYQIGFECESHFSYGMGIDDVKVTGIYTSEWTTVTNVSSPHNLTGLTPETQYVWQVQGSNCDGEGSTTDWSEVGTFTTNSVLELADNDAEKPDGEKNADLISGDDGTAKDVMLAGRTLFKDGDWNTLCLPFDVVVGSGQMAGATAMTMNAAQSGFDSASGLLTLYFDGVGEGSTIAAGTPFIVKWTGNAGQFVENPMFSGVTISGTAAGSISFGGGSFRGTYNVMTFDAADPNVVLLEEGSNTLKYAASGDYLGACRAYFVVAPTAAGEGQTGARLTDYILHLGSLGLLEGSFNQRGDANGDGSISVTDIAVVVNCILQLTNNGGFSKYGADANGDGDITVTDIGVIVDLILGTSGNAASRRLTHDAPEPQ